MSKMSGQQAVCVDSKDFLKPSARAVPKKSNSKLSTNNVSNLSGSCGDLTQHGLKSSPSVLSRDDSISSKSSSKSLFSNIMQSFDSTSGFSISQGFVPRIEKTFVLFDIIISTLKDLNKKYAEYSHTGEGSEGPEKGEMNRKVENRILLVQNLRKDYEALIQSKEVEVANIRTTIKTAMSSKNAKEELDMMDCESYWEVCRELCIVESKLERCAGKLQFQIMELDSVSRVSAFDQYELSIRLNDVSKFKTRIKIEKNGHQVWDSTTFVWNPTVDDCLEVKFQELKTLNKSLVLLERKVSFVNNLILSDPSIYSFWLTPVGTIKLKVIVQWNACIDDPDLLTSFSVIDNKYHDLTVKDGVTIRKRPTNTTGRFSHNRLSVNFGSLFRSDGFDRTSPRGSMENIAERVEDESIHEVHSRKLSSDYPKDRVLAEYIESPVQTETTVAKNIAINVKQPTIGTTQTEDNDGADHIVQTIVSSGLMEATSEGDENSIPMEASKVILREVGSVESKSQVLDDGRRYGTTIQGDEARMMGETCPDISDEHRSFVINNVEVAHDMIPQIHMDESNKCQESQLIRVEFDDIGVVHMEDEESRDHMAPIDMGNTESCASGASMTTIDLGNTESCASGASMTTIDLGKIESCDSEVIDVESEVSVDDRAIVELGDRESCDNGADNMSDHKTTVEMRKTEIMPTESYDNDTIGVKDEGCGDEIAMVDVDKSEIVETESCDGEPIEEDEVYLGHVTTVMLGNRESCDNGVKEVSGGDRATVELGKIGDIEVKDEGSDRGTVEIESYDDKVNNLRKEDVDVRQERCARGSIREAECIDQCLDLTSSPDTEDHPQSGHHNHTLSPDIPQ